MRAWIALERFDTKTLEAADRPGRAPRGRRRFAVDVGPREPLPWQSGHVAYGAALTSDKVEWRHTLHVGQYDIGGAYERVEAAFPDADASRERRRPTRAPAPLLALALTPDGRPIMDSLQVSSAAWSIAQTLRLGVDDPKWLVGFDDAQSEVRGAFERIVMDAAGSGRPKLAAEAEAGVPLEGRAALSVVAPDLRIEQAPPSLLMVDPSGDRDSDSDLDVDSGSGPDVDPETGEIRDCSGDDDDGESVGDGASEGREGQTERTHAAAPLAVADRADDDSNIIEAIDDEGIGVEPITWDHLLRLLGAATAILETDGQIAMRPVARSTTWAESRRVPYGTGDTLLNSFAVDDLERVAFNLDGSQPGEALARYLDASHVAVAEANKRIDVDEGLAHVRVATEPRWMPAGRWPADATHDLALGQQLAVNLATQKVSPLVAVNGPPGTGKTTMLRDLIAGIVTERAEVIAGFNDASELFGKEVVSVNGDRVVRVNRVSAAVAGREILLACATNAAAQNVSLELPDRGAIDVAWRTGDGYLADFATAALRTGALADLRFSETGPAASRPPAAPAAQTLDGFEQPDAPKAPHELEAWALVAARLGRRSYCKDFASAVWWGTGPRPGDRGGGWRSQPSVAPTERSERGLGSLLNGTQNAEGREAWRASRDRFRAAHERVEAIRRERQGMADAMGSPEDLEQACEEAEIELADFTEQAEALERERAVAAAQAAPLVLEHQQARKRLEACGEAPPGFTMAKLSKAARAKEQLRRDAEQEAALAHRYAKDALERVSALARRIALAMERAAAAHEARDLARGRLAARKAAGAGDAAGGPGPAFVVPDESWETDQERRDRRAPWSDEDWNRARTECFLAALDLHEATILANGRDARRNLAVAIDLISGRVSGLTHDVVLAAWQTLFLLVPVISTTFASLPTMLGGIGREDLGWLLIDEAGQAEPQQAAGAIWRCKRAVVVGDPLQLEPVSALPTSLADAIRERYGVPREYISSEASVQRLADAVMPWGGERGDEDLWVGVPMNVHRRCETPIFDLVNAIAYGGRMVNATVPRAAHAALRVESCWLDVPGGGASDGHWIVDEGVRLDNLLAHLGMNGYDFRQVFAVSPFRDVAWQLRRRAEDPRHPGMTGGTIHTIQGREADTVILVLGGNPTQPGARRWVSEKPNLLNVAVSRARQRLYVIGDHDAWIGEPYVRELAGLRRVAPPARRR